MSTLKRTKRALLLLLTLALTAGFLTLCACKKGSSTGGESGVVETQEKTITVEVVDDKGETTSFTITTVEAFLRGALEQENLIEGEESATGLYVKVVNGLTADYDVDKSYWAFYKGEDYLMTGVDSTPIADGDLFRIVYTN